MLITPKAKDNLSHVRRVIVPFEIALVETCLLVIHAKDGGVIKTGIFHRTLSIYNTTVTIILEIGALGNGLGKFHEGRNSEGDGLQLIGDPWVRGLRGC